jgi:hypothetical protein
MPAIQVYKSKGAMIPVDQAKQARAYICPWTEKLFATKKSYLTHLKTLRTNRMWAQARRRRFQQRLAEMWNLNSFEKIVEWAERNSDVFWQNGKNHGWTSDVKQWDAIRDDFCIKITYIGVNWNDCVSNTHDCPHNGVTNWSSDEDKPKGYPGWTGRIQFKLSHRIPGFSSNLLEGTRIHTGSGGGGGDTYSYSVAFFEEDWPGLSKARTMAILEGNEQKRFVVGEAVS